MVAPKIRLGGYRRVVCTFDVFTLRGVSPGISNRREIWLDWVALLSAILAIATVAGMVVFTWLTLAGVEKLKLRALEKFESGILGGVLCLLGVLIILFER